MHALLILLLACKDKSAEDTDHSGHSGDDTSSTSDDTGGTDTPYAEAVAAVQTAVELDLRGALASGASLAVWKDGEIVYAAGFGSRHPDREEAVATTTLFQIGSDTKKIVALAALQQVEAGKLSLDDTVADIVPELVFAQEPGLAGELTLHELLSHQTGVYDYTPWTQASDDAELYNRAVGRFAENEYALGPSGLFWSYANPNFSLAGLMTQQVDGRMWGDIIEEDVFAPLGMTRSIARLEDVIADGDYAIGSGYYAPDGYDTFNLLEADQIFLSGTVEMENQVDDAFTRPAGMVWSTASDMATLAGFLLDGDPSVLSDDLRAQITTPHIPLYPASSASDLSYGYGMMLNGFGFSGLEGFYDGVPLWSHGGNTLAMTSTFFVLPEQRVAVAILSNGYGDDFTTSAVTALEAFADLPAPTAARSFLQEPADVADLAGTWVDPHVFGRLILTWDGTDLLVSAPDIEALGATTGSKLRPYYRDIYLLRINGWDYSLDLYQSDDGAWLINRQFSFVRDDKGATAALTGSAAAAPLRGLPPPAVPPLDPRAQAARLLGLPAR